ncbi:MAG: hypothetical protein U1F46_02770 [Marinagarivorans sp.]
MISEKMVASVFNGFWDEVLPLLTPSFVRVFNEAHSEELVDLPSSKFIRIPIAPEVTKHDLVAEFAFCAAEASHTFGCSVTEIINDRKAIESIYAKAVNFLKRYASDDGEILLNKIEINEASKLALQYHSFFQYLQLHHSQIEFRPQIKGAGFLGNCTADISTGDTLYEVKATSRNLAGKDIRQLLVYLGLRSAADSPQWEYAGFFNPRRALHYRFSVEHLIYRTSGGRSKTEVFDRLIRFLDSREIELDTPF